MVRVEKEPEGDDARDPRVHWMLQRVLCALGPLLRKKDAEMQDDDALQLALRNFCDSASQRVLYVAISAATGRVEAHAEPAADFGQRKVVYFLKRRAEAAATREGDQLASLIHSGELAPAPLPSLLVGHSGVYNALYARDANLASVPEIGRAELAEHAQRFRAALAVAHGTAEGRTVLPLPAKLLPTADKEVAGQLGKVLAGWMQQIRSAVEAAPESLFDPAHPVTKGAPGALHELQFWERKASNLLGLEKQLASRRHLLVLREAGCMLSTPSTNRFASMEQELRAAAAEAASNANWLRPLAEGDDSPLEQLGGTHPVELPRVPQVRLFERLFRWVLRVWEESPHYNTPQRMTAFLRAVANDLITCACHHVGDSPALFRGDAEEAAARVAHCLSAAGHFQQCFRAAKGKAEESTRGPWRLQDAAVCGRLDRFQERCHDVLDLLETVMLFARLDPETGRVAVGGTRGGELAATLQQVYKDFSAAYQEFHSAGGHAPDALALDDPIFDARFLELREAVRSLERRLAAVYTGALADATSVPGMAKVTRAFADFAKRPVIADELQQGHATMVQAFHADLLEVQGLFVECTARQRRMSDARAQARALVATAGQGGGLHSAAAVFERQHPFDRLPPTAARIVWARSLADRIRAQHSIVADALASSHSGWFGHTHHRQIWAEAEALCHGLCRALEGYVSQQSSEWADKVGCMSVSKMQSNLLARDRNKRLAVSFDPALTRTLKEASFLRRSSPEGQAAAVVALPAEVEAVHKQRDRLRVQLLKLDAMSAAYNTMQDSMTPYERPLFNEEFARCDAALARGVGELTWQSPEAEAFVGSAKRAVDEIERVWQALRAGRRAMQELIDAFRDSDRLLPLQPDAKGARTLTPELFAQMAADHRGRRQAEAGRVSAELQRLLCEGKSTLDQVKGRGQGDAPARWAAYAEDLSQFVAGLVISCVQHSLQNLHDQLCPVWQRSNGGLPLLEVKLVLEPPPAAGPARRAAGGGSVAFRPPLSGPAGLEALIGGLAEDSIQIAAHFSQLGPNAQQDSYLAAVARADPVCRLQTSIQELVRGAAAECAAFRAQFDSVGHAWLRGTAEDFADFVAAGRAAAAEAGAPDPTPPDAYLTRMLGRPLEDFDAAVGEADRELARVGALPECGAVVWVRIDAKPLKCDLRDLGLQWRAKLLGHLQSRVHGELSRFFAFIHAAERGLEGLPPEGDAGEAPAGEAGVEGEALKEKMRWVQACRDWSDHAAAMGEPLSRAVSVLQKYLGAADESVAQALRLLGQAPDAWETLYRRSLTVREEHGREHAQHAERTRLGAEEFAAEVEGFAAAFASIGPLDYLDSSDAAYRELDRLHGEVAALEEKARCIREEQQLFETAPTEFAPLKQCRAQLLALKGVWDLISHVRDFFDGWLATPFQHVATEELVDEVAKLQRQLKGLPPRARPWACAKGLQEAVKGMAQALPLIRDLREEAMRGRHWAKLFAETGHGGIALDPQSPECTLRDLMGLGLHAHPEAVQGVVERAARELQLETALQRTARTWENMQFDYTQDQGLDCWLLGSVEELVDALETDSNLLQQMLNNRFVDYFRPSVSRWLERLGCVESCVSLWAEVQRKWANLYPIFVLSPDMRSSLPEDAESFRGADKLFRNLMSKARLFRSVIAVCCTPAVTQQLQRADSLEGVFAVLRDILRGCERSLAKYLEAKKKQFPRLFFLADADIVDVLSKGSDPPRVMVHMSKVVDAIETLEFDHRRRNVALRVVSTQGERLQLSSEFPCRGPVEQWLQGCLARIQATLKHLIEEASSTYLEQPRVVWIKSYPCQAIIVASRIHFTAEVHQGFAHLEDGNEAAMKELLKAQQRQLGDEIGLVLGELTKNDRAMLVHLITVDVHSRDVVQSLIDIRAENDSHFSWQSQLRYYSEERRGTVIRICDSELVHGCEYTGLCGCLVITKLTDRCYITLTQALRLVQGGAPAGPAGTGKTETTKDLARNVGVPCYVFNCSDQMDHQGLGRIFKGLAMVGAWGCFDEFNRIAIEVLSVVATQVGSILHGIRRQRATFHFAGEEEIPLVPTCGIFITMNPGYAGRTELPENIKSLFRPCAMIVPDIRNICEILLAAEGFKEARVLAQKFVQLYRLNSALLSPMAHYDWGLRAVKSVLAVAGNLRRADPQLHERGVLLRALRDSNMAKLARDDVAVFQGLIRALFPGLTVPPLAKEGVASRCQEACRKLELLTGEGDVVIQKCLQLDDLFSVRHSVIVLGPAGCGKTEVLRVLREAYSVPDPGACKVRFLNPKAMNTDEMYGYAHPQTKEWRDGHLAIIFKEFSVLSKTNDCRKWIVLDGVIDAEWIESMNTVMDDNKTLTLANNDRIPLAPSMRMLFEVSHVSNASPATVSRAGILYINAADIGWVPYKDRWLLSRDDDRLRGTLDSYFDTYFVPALEEWRRYHKTVVPITELSAISSLCNFLVMMLEKVTPRHHSAEVYEKIFCFCCVWALGAPLPSDGRIDYRALFSRYWVKAMQGKVRICEDRQLIFDYYLDEASWEFRPWLELVNDHAPAPGGSLAEVFVETADTVRAGFFIRGMMERRAPFMLVGTAGTGKSHLLAQHLRSLDTAVWTCRRVAFNAQTSVKSLQSAMEAPLERSGRIWRPPGRKRLFFFVDDINMPEQDKYGTQAPIAFLRHFADYGFWFDRGAPGQERHVTGLQFAASMNHKTGSFTILDRLQRWFTVLAISMPPAADLHAIYSAVLSHHWRAWGQQVLDLVDPLVQGAIDLHKLVAERFRPTALRFHYQWNMRELCSVFQGVMCASRGLHNVEQLVRLWRHECERTYRDRLVDEADAAEYDDLMLQVITARLCEFAPIDDVLRDPNLWGPFGSWGDATEVYDAVESHGELHAFLSRKLRDYNEQPGKAAMELVLFGQAMEHLCRISRILSRPRGNALLVGVGGSGKQSLSRLSAFICELDSHQVQVTASYCAADFTAKIADLYVRCGRKSQRVALLLTDAQITLTEQLVVLSDLLSSGDIPGLFEPEARDDLATSVAPELRQQQRPDHSNREACWEYFISKVRANLHVVLCFSPVGAQFRSWCRKFPALSSTTVIDWFHPWPAPALVSVAQEFLLLEGSPLSGDEQTVGRVAEHVGEAHGIVSRAAEDYRLAERRYCYTTPKSFLELVATYKQMLADQRVGIEARRRVLADGIQKIRHAGEEVSKLQEQLREEEVHVAKSQAECAKLMDRVAAEQGLCRGEAQRAQREQENTAKLLGETNALKDLAERDLREAQPYVERAKAALRGLNKGSLTELKSFSKPPQEVLMVTAAVMCLTARPDRIPRPEQAKQWQLAKKMMANVSAWLKELEVFGNETSHNIPQPCVDAIQQWVTDPAFDADRMRTKSEAASCLSSWVTNIDAYHRLRRTVVRKEEKLQDAKQRLEASEAQLRKAQEKVAQLSARLNELEASHGAAVERGRVLQEQAAATRQKMSVAERLVGGLASEGVRWAGNIDEITERTLCLVGDVLLASAFVSYLGPFNKPFRERVLGQLRGDIAARGIAHTHAMDVVSGVLASDAEVAGWSNEGLPGDRMSTENGAIVKNAKRWPLLIDPQLQGARWIKAKEEPHGLLVTQPSARDFHAVVQRSMESGLPCLVEHIGDGVDPVLDPVLSKTFVRRGGVWLCHFGGDAVSVDTGSFRLYLQTKDPNPHYKPELNAQTTLVNFCVTESGLGDQLLALVVNQERPELEERKVALLQQTSLYRQQLQDCEEQVLQELALAEGDILANTALVDSLERTKQRAALITRSLVADREAQAELHAQRLGYRPCAERGSLLYFEMHRLSRVDTMYHFSLSAFVTVLLGALGRTPWPRDEEGEEDRSDVPARVESITEAATAAVYAYVSRSLFQRHKLIFAAMLCLAVQRQRGAVDPQHLEYLFAGAQRTPEEPPPEAVREWCTPAMWAGACALADLPRAPPSRGHTAPPFSALAADLAQHSRWRQWAEHPAPEGERLPADWRALGAFERLLVVRSLRPDRLTAALTAYVADKLGSSFVAEAPVTLAEVYADCSPERPLFFILSPGDDPVGRVEALGARHGFTYDAGSLFNVSLGQGQEARAEEKLAHCFNHGGWVMLSNVHLTQSWLPQLEQTLDTFAKSYERQEQARRRRDAQRAAAAAAAAAEAGGGAAQSEAGDGSGTGGGGAGAAGEVELIEGIPGHPGFRVFISAEPSADPRQQTIPIGILQRSMKLTNEPPSGAGANLQRALGEFAHEPWEASLKPTEYKAIVYAMCWFHAVVVERKKFGPQGWNRCYPFNHGDLTSCIDVLHNCIEERPSVPWADLRYVYGEIMYGGHITDDWDRRLCSAYLDRFICPEVCVHLELCPGFFLPHFENYADACATVKDVPAEAPALYGLHPNAEIGYRIAQAELLFFTIGELQPQSVTGDDGDPRPEAVRRILEEILTGVLPDSPFVLSDISERLEDDQTPQQHVFYQECERINLLQATVRESLHELDLCLRGALSMSEGAQAVSAALLLGRVPESWRGTSFASMRPLASWCTSFSNRLQQLTEWAVELLTPKVTRLDLLFNPMSFLTSVVQSIATQSGHELDQMDLVCEPTKRMPANIDSVAREGAHVWGLTMEGARWDTAAGGIEHSRTKELFCVLPVVTVRAAPTAKIDHRDQYECPVYKTQQRSTGFVVSVWLRSKHPSALWVIAGVACLFDVVD